MTEMGQIKPYISSVGRLMQAPQGNVAGRQGPSGYSQAKVGWNRGGSFVWTASMR